MRIITNEEIVAYKNYLAGEEKSSATIGKYLHDVSELQIWLSGKEITKSAVFVTKNGNPLDRSNIWSDMKKLCKAANVSEKKVFPHNLRHLFARTYISLLYH